MQKILLLVTLMLGSLVGFSQSDTTLKEFSGKFTFPSGSVVSEVTVVYEDGALSVNTPFGSSSLERKSGDEFAIPQFQGSAKFKRDASNKVIGVTVEAMGYILEGTKETSFAKNNFRKLFLKKNKLYWA